MATDVTHLPDRLLVIAAERGVFLRRDALAAGMDDRSLAAALGQGAIKRVRHGAYVPSMVWHTARREARLKILTQAVAAMTRNEIAASHHSASALHGLDMWEVPTGVAHFTRLDGQPGRSASDVTFHVGRLSGSELVTVGGVLATPPARAAVESATLLDAEHGLCLINSGLQRRLFSPDDLAATLRTTSGWPHTQHLQIVGRLADGRCESVGESRGLHLFFRHGIPLPELQYEVWHEGVLIAVCDWCWPEHGLFGEFDGKEKYLRYLREGETPGDAVFREKKREDLLRRVTGFGMVRLTWADYYQPDRTAAMVRGMLRAAA